MVKHCLAVQEVFADLVFTVGERNTHIYLLVEGIDA